MKTKKFELIELQIGVSQGVGRVNFNSQVNSQLGITAMIKGIETFNVLNVSTSPNGLPVIAVADCAKTYLGLYVSGEDRIVRMPLVVLNRMQISAQTYGAAQSHLQEFEDLMGVDWGKSYIQFAAAPAATAFSILLGVHYV